MQATAQKDDECLGGNDFFGVNPPIKASSLQLLFIIQVQMNSMYLAINKIYRNGAVPLEEKQNKTVAWLSFENKYTE